MDIVTSFVPLVLLPSQKLRKGEKKKKRKKREWKILKELLPHKCKEPKIKNLKSLSFQPSIKAYFLHYAARQKYPFDRYDWQIDRCGTTVRYIVDYYAIERNNNINNPQTKDIQPFLNSYIIDARPDLRRLGNWKDRIMVQWARMKYHQQLKKARLNQNNVSNP
ncbi:cytochrome C-type heme lyase [Reticulomyxa filosa]|uniref:Holocytochrome c-type synthase n=1 Tax=Reticulomyxa filosa TaxID=46433 RepID=X6NXL1_RETFI|nr:cytochrome C-type heme lyase [Reticulomyxa filosa]|eukprot:ETO30559.1 cytochrome C-type heme lyase [Reticulomyxa filosa]